MDKSLHHKIWRERFPDPLMNTSQEVPSDVLCGWKKIAHYLGKGVRTVQRYELQFGLPVSRPNGSDRGSVWARKSELAAWVYASPLRKDFDLSRTRGGSVYNSAIPRRTVEIREFREQLLMLNRGMLKAIQLLAENTGSAPRR